MDDDAAYMALVTSNSQGELSPLEIGMHALHCVALGKGGRGQKGGLFEYAAKVGRGEAFIRQIRKAAEVVEKLVVDYGVLQDKSQHLSAIHALPRECWQAAKVASAISSLERINDLQEKYAHLSAIYALPRECWQAAGTNAPLRCWPLLTRLILTRRNEALRAFFESFPARFWYDLATERSQKHDRFKRRY